jgi:hypothetical protein
MVNASFVFGMDGDDETVFESTVEWAIAQGVETATFHILTPYPGTPLYQRLAEHRHWAVVQLGAGGVGQHGDAEGGVCAEGELHLRGRHPGRRGGA